MVYLMHSFFILEVLKKIMAYKNIKNIIISSSYTLFKEKGYNNVSVNEICRACSITKPTFYYHFKAKEDILFAFFTDKMENLSDSIFEIAQAANGKELVMGYFKNILNIFKTLGYDIIKNILIASINDMEKSVKLPDNFRKHTILAIKKGQKDYSILNSSNPEYIYSSLQHIFFGYLHLWCQHNGLISDIHSLSDAIEPVLGT